MQMGGGGGICRTQWSRGHDKEVRFIAQGMMEVWKDVESEAD